jgi:hypothetical protein
MSTTETVRFRLLAGVDAAEFAQIDLRMENGYMRKRPGFQDRALLRSAVGDYLVVVHWASAQEADATMGGFFTDPLTQDFLAAVDKSTVQSGRYAPVER